MKSLIPAALIFLTLVLGCGLFGNKGLRSAKNDPYKGKVADVLDKEIPMGRIKFKLLGIENNETFPGSTEAISFSYMQKDVGPDIRVDGALANYPSAQEAAAKLTDITKKFSGKLQTRGYGRRFTSTDGTTIAWTNGSLLCITKSVDTKAVNNFDDAVPF
jgi:hypothetical protein